MRRTAFILPAALSLVLAGCMLNGQQPPKVSATPPPPKPSATPTPAATPPPAALSLPQTTAQLPAPQPISPEALAIKVEPVETPAPPRPARRSVPAPPKPAEPPVTQAQTPPPVPAAPAEPERPALQEILPPAESKRLQESAINRKREIKRVLDQTRPVSDSQRALVARIRTFVQQSDEAEGRGEMRLADALAERAQVLVRELQGGR